MRRRDLLAAIALVPGLRSIHSGSGPVGSAGVTPPDADFLASLPGVLGISGVPGIGMGLVSHGRMTWHAHAGVVFLWA
jgi:hypothetical protein